MLRNLESSAQGTRSPGRLLITHWPVGIVAGSSDALWKPTSGSVGGSQALQPFAERGLGPDMTVIRGLTTPNGAGGAEEGGTVSLVTGVAPPGVRSGQVESDDAYAGGPSFEQLLLQKVAGLKRTPITYANAIVDSRTDYGETGSKTLSYSTTNQSVGALSGPGIEAEPLRGKSAPSRSSTPSSPPSSPERRARAAAMASAARAAARHSPSPTLCSRSWWAGGASSISQSRS